MYGARLRHTLGVTGGDPGEAGEKVSATRLVSRRRALGGIAALGCLAHIPIARAGVNLGRAPQMLGGLTNTHNAFTALISAHYPKISAVNLSASEWGLLGLAYPMVDTLLSPAARSKYAARQKLFICPPTLGCLGALDSTLTEIYLDFRLFGGALYGALSLEAATLATATYYGGLVLSAYGLGFAAGSKLAGWMQIYTPDAWDHIVTIVGSASEALTSFGGAITQLANTAATNTWNTDAVFGYESWRLNASYFDVPSESLGIGGSLGFGSSYGWGVFDSISSVDAYCLKAGNC